jgi:4-hydroxythreonine-4-phosphate dehydrogenase
VRNVPDRIVPRIAISIGDPSGIGPEISLRAALDPTVNTLCRLILVGDPAVIAKHARAAGLAPTVHVITDVTEAAWSNSTLDVLAVPMPDGSAFEFGKTGAPYGRAALASASRAIEAALAGDVDAVVAAPMNQISIAAAGIAFDGHPGFVAHATGMSPHDVFLMLCFGDTRIVHCTLHVSIVEAVALITRERVGRAIRAADTALKRIGIAAPRICVSGLNPHAGEDGLFGREEIEIISPAIADTKLAGIDVSGPFGCDTMFHRKNVDAFVVMLHDQGHITAKLLAPNEAAALTIGSPILFSSVAHGSGADIAGKGVANPAAMIEALTRLAGTSGTSALATRRGL